MSISVLNTDAGLSGKTIVNIEDAQTVSGLKTFDRDPNPPFAVSAGSDVVANLAAQYASEPLDGQLAFPSAQNPSTNANTLDDYEEGTFSPTLVSSGGGAPTYATQAGQYVKVGQMVTAHGQLQITSKGTLAAGTLTMGGFPFSANGHSTISIGYFEGMSTSIIWFGGYIGNTTTSGNLVITTAATTSVTLLTVAHIGDTLNMVFSVTYRATQ